MSGVHSTLRSVRTHTAGTSGSPSPRDSHSDRSTNELIHAAIQRLEVLAAVQSNTDVDDSATPPSSPPSPAIDSAKDVAKALANAWMKKVFGPSSGFGFDGRPKNKNDVTLEKTMAVVAGEKENTPAGGKSPTVQQVEREYSPVLLATRPDGTRLLDILNAGTATADADATPPIHVHNSISIPPSNGFDANLNSEYSCAPATGLAETSRFEQFGLGRRGDPQTLLDILNAGAGEVASVGHACACQAEAGAGQAPFRFDPFGDGLNAGYGGIARADRAHGKAQFKFDPFAEDDNSFAEPEMFEQTNHAYNTEAGQAPFKFNPFADDDDEWPDTVGFLDVHDDGEPLRWPPVIETPTWGAEFIGPHRQAMDLDAPSQQYSHPHHQEDGFVAHDFGVGTDPLPPASAWSMYTEESPYRRTSMTPLSLEDVITAGPGGPTFWDFWFSLPPLSTTLPFLFGFDGEREGGVEDAGGDGAQHDEQHEQQGRGADGYGEDGQRASGAVEHENGSDNDSCYDYPVLVGYAGCLWNPEDLEWDDASSDGPSECEELGDEDEDVCDVDSETGSVFIQMSC